MSAQEQENNEEIKDNQVDTDTMEESATDEEATLESPEKNADSLEAQLEDAQAKASENWDQFVRARAEMDNLRRRNTIDLENAHKFGTEKLVTELLPVLDSMAMGLAVEEATVDSLREGMQMTMSMFEKMLEKAGIEEINPVDEKFDAEKHQAMTMQPAADVEPNTVISVMQKGYALNGRLIRPAMVIVSKAAD